MCYLIFKAAISSAFFILGKDIGESMLYTCAIIWPSINTALSHSESL